MKLLWTLQTDNQPRQLHNLFAPLIVSAVATDAGPREIAVLAGVSDNLYGVDVDKGTQIWKRHFDSTYEEPAGGRGGGPLCPGGLTATPVVAADGDGGGLQDLCDFLGWAPPPTRRGHREGPRAGRTLPPGKREAVRAQPREQRAVHDDGTGVRRQSRTSSTPTISRRRRSAASIREAEACGRDSGPPLARTAPSTPEAAMATTTPNSRFTDRRSSR